MAKAKRTGKESARAAPRWFGAAPEPGEPVPGLPSFATLDWIAEWSSLSPPALRRLHDSIDAPAWWPERCPTAEEVPYLLGAAMREPAFFAVLARRHLQAFPRLGAYRHSLFAPLVERADSLPRDQVLLVEFLEDPDVAAASLSALPAAERAALDDPSPGSLLSWLRLHFPEAAGSVSETPPPGRTPEPEPGPASAPTPVPTPAVPAAAADLAPPVAAAGPAPEPLDEAALRGEIREALSDAATAAAAALSAGGLGRGDAAPLVLSALRASRGMRRLARHLSQPVDAGELLAVVADAARRVAALTKGAVPEVPGAPFPVARPAEEGLRSLSSRLASGAADIESLQAGIQEQGRRLGETGDIDIAVEISALRNRIRDAADAFHALLSDALAQFLAARVEAPAPAPAPRPAPTRAPAPAVAPVGEDLPVVTHVVLDLGPYGDAPMAAALALCLEFVGEWRGPPPVGEDFEIGHPESGHTLRAARSGRSWACLWSFPTRTSRTAPGPWRPRSRRSGGAWPCRRPSGRPIPTSPSRAGSSRWCATPSRSWARTTPAIP